MYLADIRANDYESFRSIPATGLPDTFDKWTHQRAERAAQVIGGGNEVVSVEINPDEFAIFCRDRGAPTNLHSLDNLAAEKARRDRQDG
jgi:hypothetical protein